MGGETSRTSLHFYYQNFSNGKNGEEIFLFDPQLLLFFL
jgi:hypothetical protein